VKMIRTVRGDIPPERLGVTLPHEHLLLDLACRVEPTSDPYLLSLVDRPVETSILWDLMRNPQISKDNLQLTDVDAAIDEIRSFGECGGSAVVDQTSASIGRNTSAQVRISEATGVHIIAATGYYSPVLPPHVESATIDELADALVRDVCEGFDGSGIRAGIIGEIGTSHPLTPLEEKTLRAASRAQVRTGAALSIHPECWDRPAHRLLDIVESEGVDLHRVVICHLDHFIDLDYLKSIAARGAYVEYDRCGIERYRGLDFSLQAFPRDTDRVASIIELISAGFGAQILISHDVCFKVDLRKYGGPGYSHILRYVVPMMRQMGVSDEQVRQIIIENPSRLLAF
jgi:phosphotriesterase-related protein